MKPIRNTMICLCALALVLCALAATGPDQVPIYPNVNQFDYTARRLTLKASAMITNPAVNGVTMTWPTNNGAGALQNDGSGNLTWTPGEGGAGDSLWTNLGGILQPKDLALPVEIDSRIYFGPGSTNALYKSANYLTYNGKDASGYATMQFLGDSTAWVGATPFGAKLSTAGDQINFGISGQQWTYSTGLIFPGTDNAISLGHPDIRWKDLSLGGTEYIVGFRNDTNYSRLALYHQGTNGNPVIDSQSSGTAGQPPNLMIAKNGTNIIKLGSITGYPTKGNITIYEAGQVNYLDLGQFAGKAYITDNGIISLTSGVALEMGPSITVMNGYNPAFITIKGYDDNSGNYAHFTVTHNGTNGSVTLASTSGGTAGSPRPIQFKLGTTHAGSLAQDNTSYGYAAMPYVTTGGGNTVVGELAGYYLAEGSNNTLMGKDAGLYITNTVSNTLIGMNAGGAQTTPNGNTALGYYASGRNIGGEHVVAIGYEAGSAMTNLDHTVLIGAQLEAGEESMTRTMTDSVWIGHKAAGLTNYPETVSNFIGIGKDVLPRANNTAQIGTNGVTVLYLNGTVGWFRGSGSPEGAVTAPVGSFYSREDGGTGTTLYVKESGTGNTGWVVNSGLRLFATNWRDSMVPATAVRNGATAPTTGPFGPSGVITATMFQSNRDDEVTFSVQLGHDWKQGTAVYPHVHWAETETTTAGTNTVWELTYSWASVNGAFPTDSTITTTNAVTGTNWVHKIASFPSIDGTGKTVSSILACRLRRLASSAAADSYDKSLAFLGFDFHYEADSIGSDNEASKTP